MGKKLRFLILIGAVLTGAVLLCIYVLQHPVAVLSPSGSIASQQKNLILFTLALSMIVVIPVFALTFFIAWRYRASNSKSRYTPDWDHNRILESIWWGLPLAIISILAIVTWQTSHSLDPFKPLSSSNKAITVQVVALQWKWLFIYPDYGVASLNEVTFPEDTPVNFVITADAPMNSFWIPKLGGQIYAMSGMSTQLHLMANDTGHYRGVSANLSGKGFAGMNFTARAVSSSEFKSWVTAGLGSEKELDHTVYDKLAEPSENDPVIVYHLKTPDLYNKILDKYMSAENHAGMDHEGAHY